LVGAEREMPYNRPPLSKAVLKGGAQMADVLVRSADFWSDEQIDVVVGRRAVEIRRELSTLRLDDGSELPYEHLVLATGSRTRRLAGLPGAFALRTWQDSIAVRERLVPGRRLALIGGGFIGLELAAAATEAGAEVVIIEAAPRLLARALSTVTADFLRSEHERRGVVVHLGTTVHDVEPDHVVLGDGLTVKADTVVVGVGVTPRTELAEAAGLEVGDGIVVDEYLRTSDQRIWAVGDVALHPCSVTRRRLRIESVQNATEQARHAATQIASDTLVPYRSVPWFWTEQFRKKLLIAGVSEPCDGAELRGDPSSGSFSVCRYDAADRLVAVESVDRPKDHIEARKILAGAEGVTRASAADIERSLLA
jgi:3-phenylpropionate/trans-cinnamate dioxygenase ferredoxin reductase subunit